MRTGASTLVLIAVSMVAAKCEAAALSRRGTLELAATGGIFFTGDVVKYYGVDHSKPILGGVGGSAGVAFPCSPVTDVGLRVEYSGKRYDIDVARPGAGASVPSSTYFTDHWTAHAVGLLLTARTRYQISEKPGAFPGFAEFAFGRYTLVGARYENSLVDGRLDLSGSGWGGLLEAGVELPWPRSFTLAPELGLRFARIRPITISGDLAGARVPAQPMLDDSGKQAFVNHSEIYFRLSARIRLWGAAEGRASASLPLTP